MLRGLLATVVIFASAIGIAFLLLVARELIRPLFVEGKKSNPKFLDLIQIIDQSVSRYKDREFLPGDQNATWRCSSRLFSFTISVTDQNGRKTIRINCRIEQPFDFMVQFPRTVRREYPTGNRFFVISGTDDEAVDSLLMREELQTIRTGLLFFDYIEAGHNEISAFRDEVKRLSFSEWSGALSAFLTFVRILHQQGSKSFQELSGKANCPYCKEEIHPGSLMIQCKKCKTAQHQQCWNENGRCSVFGCLGKRSAHIRI